MLLGMLDEQIAVSYTHLDVYKRQILRLSVNTVAFSQTAKISVNFTGTPLSEVFAELGKQVKMVFLYDHKLVRCV